MSDAQSGKGKGRHEAAKLKGVKFGRPPKIAPENFEQIYNQWLEKEINAQEAAKLCNFSRTTFYRKVKSVPDNMNVY